MNQDQYILTLLVTIAGWGVVHFFSARRDRNKEWRDFARLTVTLLDEIEKKAIAYHTNCEREEKLEAEIILLLVRLDAYMVLIKKNLKFNYNISFFRSAVTLNNFQTARFKRQDSASQIIIDIFSHSTIIREGLFSAE